MDYTFYVLLGGIALVIIVAFIVTGHSIKKQDWDKGFIEIKEPKEETKYSICTKIEEADEEF